MDCGFLGERSGLLFVVSGPAGSGKGTIMNILMENGSYYTLSVSATTRAPGPKERDGVEYFFKTREEFESMIEKGELLEYTQYLGNYYGTPKAPAMEMLKTGKHVLLEIDVDGASQIKKVYPQAILVMIVPPGAKEQERRLRDRGRDSEDSVLRRLQRAKEELKLVCGYDYILVNETGKAEDTANQLRAIASAEMNSVKRNSDIYTKFFEC